VLDLKITSLEQHERFITRVVRSGTVWGLKGTGGWATAGSTEVEGAGVMPFWSDRAYANRCAKEVWAGYEPMPISLSSFLAQWLPGMAKDGFRVGTNWNGEFIGKETLALELKHELELHVSNPS
jgi:hypothetical protein